MFSVSPIIQYLVRDKSVAIRGKRKTDSGKDSRGKMQEMCISRVEGKMINIFEHF